MYVGYHDKLEKHKQYIDYLPFTSNLLVGLLEYPELSVSRKVTMVVNLFYRQRGMGR
jgi:hypothetical protein